MNKWLFYGVIFFLFLSSGSLAFAQKIDVIIDSLYVELKNANADTTKALLLAELSYRYYTIPDSAISIAKRGLTLAQAIGYQRGISCNEVSMGNYYSVVGDYVQAFKYCLKALEWQQKNGTAHELGRTNLLLGFSAFDYLGPETAVSYFRKTRFFYMKAGNSIDLVHVLNNLGFVYMVTKKYDSAMIYLNEGLELTRKTKQPEFEAVLLQTIGELHIDRKAFEEAKSVIDRSIELNKNFDPRIQSINYFKLAQIFKGLNQPTKAITNAQISLKIATANVDWQQIEQACKFLHEVFYERRDYKLAIEYLKKATQANDSVYSIEKDREVQKLSMNFEIRSKESEIKILQQENSLKQIGLQLSTDSLKRQRVILLALMLVLILLAILLTWYRMINRIKRELEIERIRNNISKDLHDDIGSTLSSIQIISKLGKQNEAIEIAQRKFSLIENHSTKIMGTMADIVWSINSNNDTLEKIVLYMKEFSAEILEPQNINYYFAVTSGLENLRIDVSVRKNLFLIFKEAINNAVKYSDCSEIRVNIAFHAGLLTMEIMDNGKGFDFHQIKLGNGLNNMKERANLINAQFDIISKIDLGTHISVSTAITSLG
jgi:two-component system, NarL family, sensor histidine kinase UhpB